MADYEEYEEVPDQNDGNEVEGDNADAGEENLADLIFNAEITDKPEEEEDTEQKATIDEGASVLLHPEEIPRDSTREFAKNLYKSFQPCQRFMTVLCRFPIISYANDDHSIVFEYNWSSVRGNLFFITFAILLTLTGLCTLNIISTMLNFPKQPENLTVSWRIPEMDSRGTVNWGNGLQRFFPNDYTVVTITKEQTELRAEEMFLFRRNIASLLIVIFLMYHIVTADWNLYNRRHFIASYLTFWSESVEIMKIDAAGEAGKFARRFLLYYVFFFLVFCTAIGINIAPVASGINKLTCAPVSFAFLWGRCFYPQIHSLEHFYILLMRGIGGFFYLYVVICSKVYVFFFLYITKLLVTSFTVWNERLEKVFSAEERSKPRKDKCASRTGYDHLFKDFVTLLDLESGADTLFTSVIESYYSMTILSIVFEVYYLVRPVSERQFEFKQARTLDMIPVGLYLFNSILIFYLVSTGAAEVGEAAANGLEIIRRQGIIGHRPDSEMHFMISLYMSYTGHFDTSLSGGGYFILDKSFFVAIAGTMISYIIIIFQFQPSLAINNPEQRRLVGADDVDNYSKLKTLIFHVENTFRYLEKREPGF